MNCERLGPITLEQYDNNPILKFKIDSIMETQDSVIELIKTSGLTGVYNHINGLLQGHPILHSHFKYAILTLFSDPSDLSYKPTYLYLYPVWVFDIINYYKRVYIGFYKSQDSEVALQAIYEPAFITLFKDGPQEVTILTRIFMENPLFADKWCSSRNIPSGGNSKIIALQLRTLVNIFYKNKTAVLSDMDISILVNLKRVIENICAEVLLFCNKFFEFPVRHSIIRNVSCLQYLSRDLPFTDITSTNFLDLFEESLKIQHSKLVSSLKKQQNHVAISTNIFSTGTLNTVVNS